MVGSQMALETSHGLMVLSVSIFFLFPSQVLRVKLVILSAAMYDFAMAQDEWYASWPVDRKERAMAM